MSSVTVRREAGGKHPAPVISTPDVFSPIRDLIEPFKRLALAPFGDFRFVSFVPAFEVKETKEGYLFTADVPGVEQANLEISVTGNRLTVSGKREEAKEESGETYYACERSYGSFTRSFTLPEGGDPEHIHADLKAGVLTISVPKSPTTKTKKVEIKAEKAAKA